MIFFSKLNGTITGDSLKNEIANLSDGRYQLEVTSLDTRNIQQNSLLWGWTYPHVQKLYQDIGMQLTIEQVHEFFKYQFLRKRKKCPITKRFKHKEGSTAKLSKKAFSTYLDQIDKDCIAKFGHGIPSCAEYEDYYP